MHSGDRMSGTVCKCMSCAGQRFNRAEGEARTCNPDYFFQLQKEEDSFERELRQIQESLKLVKNDKHDLIMTYYHKLVEEGK